METLKVLWHFVVKVVAGVAIFLVIAGAALLLWEITEWMDRQGAPYVLQWGCTGIADLLFFSDVICFGFFIIAESWKLLREIAVSFRNA